jgi:hypothetical protein
MPDSVTISPLKLMAGTRPRWGFGQPATQINVIAVGRFSNAEKHHET